MIQKTMAGTTLKIFLGSNMLPMPEHHTRLEQLASTYSPVRIKMERMRGGMLLLLASDLHLLTSAQEPRFIDELDALALDIQATTAELQSEASKERS